MEQENYHEPVLLNEAVNFLLQNKDSILSKIFVDGTLGGGGYSKKILEQTEDDTNLIIIDKDIFSIEYNKKYLKNFLHRIIFCEDNFSNISSILNSSLKKFNKEKISGFVLDLGLSSYQLNFEDGFSYQKDTPLDMRADKSQSFTAREMLNDYKEDELMNVLKNYGELKYSRKIAKDIVYYREKNELKTTNDLVNAVKENIPPRYLNKDLSKIFQAIRIEVNDELENLKICLNNVVDFMEKGARIVVISYHSLEDRIVKNFFRSSGKLKIITKKPQTASDAEISKNVRARSAKLRAAEIK